MKSQPAQKTVLITAGPTWVPIDGVRVISNIATGKTGILLARRLKSLCKKVTLLLGPCTESFENSNIRLIRFRFFNELKHILEIELKKKKYDILIHTAAVSDYRLKNTYTGKINSDSRSLSIRLVRTPKIINLIKKISPETFLVGFKFEPEMSKAGLINQAKKLIKSCGCDLVVANNLKNNRYSAYITDGRKILGRSGNKQGLVDLLADMII